MASPAAPLTEAEKEHFRQRGFIHLKNCFTKEQAESVAGNVWVRLGADPSDKSTWAERTNMPHHTSFSAKAFAPKAWAAICELLGGEDRVNPDNVDWRDSLIVNLGATEHEGTEVKPHDLNGWHVDGDFFVHYLDSPEQALLVIPMFTEVVPSGGATMICPEAIPKIAKRLYDHPEGLSAYFVPRGDESFRKEYGSSNFKEIAQSCTDFVEATGEIGDVILLHPLMLHSATPNPKRAVRIITNPPVSVKEPFNFNRPDGKYSLVEETTMRALGRDSLPEWKAKGPRERVVPFSKDTKTKMKEDELKRMAAANMEPVRKVQFAV
jgi:hypothetical protein